MIWKPTHKITFAPRDGDPKEWLVMLVPDGSAYTEHEWYEVLPARWRATPDGRWLCGSCAAPGVGTVTIEFLKN